MKWLWCAYRKEALGDLHAFLPSDMNVSEFQCALADFLDREVYVWTCEADTPQGRIPVGLIFARPYIHDILLVGSMTWFPWASKRNIYESTVAFVDQMRSKVNMIFHVEKPDKRFAEMVAKHGVARRVGTLYGVLDEPLSMFQSRKP